MNKTRRWLKSAIAASAETQVAMPWARGQRRRPEAMKVVQAQAAPAAKSRGLWLQRQSDCPRHH
jgi:hypothetical protein